MLIISFLVKSKVLPRNRELYLSIVFFRQDVLSIDSRSHKGHLKDMIIHHSEDLH